VVLLSAPWALGILTSNVLLYGTVSSLGTFVHVVNDALQNRRVLRKIVLFERKAPAPQPVNQQKEFWKWTNNRPAMVEVSKYKEKCYLVHSTA
jgi:hypothetical protein